jgi:Mg-chelatase subunit ChlI
MAPGDPKVIRKGILAITMLTFTGCTQVPTGYTDIKNQAQLDQAEREHPWRNNPATTTGYPVVEELSQTPNLDQEEQAQRTQLNQMQQEQRMEAMKQQQFRDNQQREEWYRESQERLQSLINQ